MDRHRMDMDSVKSNYETFSVRSRQKKKIINIIFFFYNRCSKFPSFLLPVSDSKRSCRTPKATFKFLIAS